MGIDVAVSFSGTGLDSSVIVSGLSSYVSGSYTSPEGIGFTIDANAHLGIGGIAVQVLPAPSEDARSFAEVGGTNITLYDNADPWTFAHEAQHNFGLDDTYLEGDGIFISTPGLMGTYGDHMINREATRLFETYCGPLDATGSFNYVSFDSTLPG